MTMVPLKAEMAGAAHLLRGYMGEQARGLGTRQYLLP